jgi:hypothetical protein
VIQAKQTFSSFEEICETKIWLNNQSRLRNS